MYRSQGTHLYGQSLPVTTVNRKSPSLSLRGTKPWTSSASLWLTSRTSRPQPLCGTLVHLSRKRCGCTGMASHLRGQHSLNRFLTCSTNVMWESLPRPMTDFCLTGTELWSEHDLLPRRAGCSVGAMDKCRGHPMLRWFRQWTGGLEVGSYIRAKGSQEHTSRLIPYESYANQPGILR